MSTPSSIFLDLSKAFDTLDHNIVLSKLKHYGINGISYNLLSTYLTNRKQYVQFESSCSEVLDTPYSVPQGSILGPLLFIIYSNDFPNASKVFQWGKYCKPITLLQKRVMRAVCYTKYNATQSLYLKWAMYLNSMTYTTLNY